MLLSKPFALLGRPDLIAYKVSPLTYILGTYLLLGWTVMSA